MKRTPLKRTAWLRRGLSRLKRFVGVKPRRATPRRKAHPANRALRAWVKAQPCCLGADLFHDGPVDPHHVRTRGAGGGELANLVPLCRYHHDALHNMGRRSFAAQYGVNLPELAQEYTLRWQVEAAPGATPPEATKRSCNRHADCDAADAEAVARGVVAASHCHDEECDECFGN